MYMGRMNVTISDSIEIDFRRAVGIRIGAVKGNMAQAIEEAILLWLKK